jgi:NosR/NirI family nitrous oxide reductase transcriptional regulator
VLCTALMLLTAILLFQDWLVTHLRLPLYVRDGFLLFTLFFIGWYALAQLSVINVLTFVHTMMHGFRWESFLIDPMMFILWSFVAVTILLWGRGVYCGWLCPYGALQELTQQVAKRFNVRQYEFPEVVHERMWAIEYIILIVLFGVSLQSLLALTVAHDAAVALLLAVLVQLTCRLRVAPATVSPAPRVCRE